MHESTTSRDREMAHKKGQGSRTVDRLLNEVKSLEIDGNQHFLKLTPEEKAKLDEYTAGHNKKE